MAPAVLRSSFYSDDQFKFKFGLIKSAASDVNSRKLRKIISTGGACLTGEFSDVMCPVRRIPRDFGANYRMFNVCSSFSGLLLGLLVLAVGYLDYVNAHTHQLGASDIDNFYGHPLNEFSSHTIIKPQIYHGKHKRAITNTLEEEGLHASHITLSFEHDGRKVLADLQLNEQLIPQGHFLRYRKSNGENVVQNLTKTEVDLCHYQGTIRGNLDSRVAVSTCNGINGVIFDGTDTYFIYSGTDGQLHDDHYLFRHADRIQNATCGFDSHRIETHSTKVPHKDSKFNRFFRYKRSTADNIIRGPYNANKHSSFVELVIVVDNKVYKSFGENIKKVHNHCKDIANIVNALYVPLNIFIALVGVVVWTESNEIEFSSNGDTTLKNFLHYRRKELVKNHPNDNAQLLTKETFEGGVVGKALKGPICTFEYSGGVSVEHSPVVAVVATTVAHEMGHNFGMEHDEPECDCVDKKCIMSASSTSYPPSHWSSCSIDQLNVAFSRGMNYCLRNKPTKLFDSPQCGNGFVEAGEQCDCGLPDYCENTCCDPNTCMLHANASCATGECCDLTTCRPKAAGTECRSAEGECDLPEYCTGESEYCPTDVFKRDTEVCDGGQAFCYQGGCRSRSSQCKILWGPSGNSSDHCYEKNTDGTRHGNCGFDRLTNQYMQCKLQDVQCGMLHCRHVNERLEFGMESVAVLSHSFMNHLGSIIPCRTAIVDLGLQSTDPGLTPNGAKCGNNKMCVDQKCISIEHLRAQGVGVECPENCNGNGYCNSKGHCHCAVGFSPPFCSSPGSGGSEDSGPATNPNSRIGFTRAMYIFFLGVVPVVSLLLFFTYYWKHRPIGTRKAASVLKTPIKTSQSRGPTSPSSGGLPTSTPSSTDDMNSALLKSPTDDTAIINNTMFGKFKGFTLRPLPAAGPTNLGAPNVAFVHPVAKSTEDSLQANGVPLRLAPPVPKPPIIQDNHQTDVKMIKQNGTLPRGKKQPPTYLGDINITAPALPPPNPGFNGRPIISHPVLEASTCTAKELISPLKTTSVGLVPVRAAPLTPPVLSPADAKPQLPNLADKKGKDGTIKRIASFLKKEEKVDNSSQKYPPKLKPVLDREKLKNIEISSPIPVVDQSDSESVDDNHQQVARTQSMRDQTPTKKPNIMSFGSMRQSGAVRPKSIVGSRPKSPPPRPPAPPIVNNLKTSVLSDYQYPKESKPVVPQNEYDDCEAIEAPLAHISEENSPTNSDNIYSVIDERPSAVLKPPAPLNLISGSNDSMGLLGEIVNEIEKRNVDSIYSASTLKKKKSPESTVSNVNTSDVSDYSEGDYVKSNGSTTSSGYLRPSALNAPVARVAPTRPDLPPSTTAVSAPVSNSSSTTSSLSSFKPKTNAPQLASKQEQKPTSIVGKAPSSPSSTRRMLANKIKAPTSLNTTTKISDSVRKRSPSPAGSAAKTTTGLNRSKPFAAKTSPGITRKNPTGDPPKGSANDTGKKSTITSAGTQKPKPLSKPAVINKPSSSSVTNNSTSAESKFGRQNSAGDTSKSTVGNNAAFKRTKSTDATVTNPKSSTNNSLSNNSNSSISSNKVLNSAAARPALGKISNVASLQQKFENASSNKATANSNSSTGNSLSSVRK